MSFKVIRNIFIGLFAMAQCHIAHAQSETIKSPEDSVIQLVGVVMSSDSLKSLAGTTIYVNDGNRGTIANDEGIFSIAVLKGDKITFSYVGYKNVIITIPTNLKTNQYSLIQLLTEDTSYLPATIIQSKMTAAEFERYFLKTASQTAYVDIEKQRRDAERQRALMNTLPNSPREAFGNQMRQGSVQYYSGGGMPSMNNVLNPSAWKDFIRSWKRGDYRN